MKRVLSYLVVLLVLLTCGACRRAAERAAGKIRIEAVEQILPKGLSSAEAVLRIANGTSHRLQVEQAEFVLHYKSTKALTIRLQEPFEVGRRTVERIPTRWRIQAGDPLAMLLLGRELLQGDPSQIFVSYSFGGRGGPARINLGEQTVPLSEFLRIFGVTLEDIKLHFNL